MPTCSVQDCEKQAKEGTLCYAHARYKRRNPDKPFKDVGVYRRPPLELVTRASLRYADAADDDEDSYKKAKDLLRKHAAAYRKKGAENVRKPLK